MQSVLEFLVSCMESVVDFVFYNVPTESYLHHTWNVRAMIAVVLVCLVCGWVGSLVVGNRMAFFSDALAHCAFTGVAIAYLTGVFAQATTDKTYEFVVVPLIMVFFGILAGLAIAFVRERSGLASDTVIGVFFAGAIGFGAMLFRVLARVSSFNPEAFLFGNPTIVPIQGLLLLVFLVVITAVFLIFFYNQMVFASFNPSLARSRRVAIRLSSYVLIVLLAIIVNLCLSTVGALLINAMLVVPAATASLVSRNMRQLFWITTALSLAAGISGHWLSWVVKLPIPGRSVPLDFNIGGSVVVLSVVFFALAMMGRGGKALMTFLVLMGFQGAILLAFLAPWWVWLLALVLNTTIVILVELKLLRWQWPSWIRLSTSRS